MSFIFLAGAYIAFSEHLHGLLLLSTVHTLQQTAIPGQNDGCAVKTIFIVRLFHDIMSV